MAVRRAVAGLIALGLSTLAWAQTAPEYRVGPGDVLSIEVVGHPELSSMPAVRSDGRIRLQDGRALGVVELTPGEIAASVTAALRRSVSFPVEVRVSVSEYRSRFVSVEGAVVKPGRVALRAGRRLVDVLVDAGGFAEGASGEVVILRRAESGDAPLRRLRVQVPADLDALGVVNLGQPLEDGDRVAVLQVEHVAVWGAVHRPGVYRLRDAPTLLSALAVAGGTGSDARRAELDRHQGEDLEIDLEAARRGQAPDPVLASGDVISVR